MAKYPDTPELDKVTAVHDATQSAGFFLDWLVQNGVTLCVYHDGYMELEEDETEDDLEEDIDNPAGWYPKMVPIQDLLAEWQGIDQNKAEEERVAILEWIRAEQELK